MFQVQRIGVALGAGAASALLFAATAKGTALAMALAFLAPLPIIIACLGWGIDMGALAALAAAGVAAGLIDPLSGGVFAATVALPAWMLGAIAQAPAPRLFGRKKDHADKEPIRPLNRSLAKPSADWFPVGGVVAAASLIGAAIGLVSLVSLIVVYGGYQKGVEALVAQLTPDIKDGLGDLVSLPSGVTMEQFATLVVRMSPMMLAAVTFLMFCVNLYAGARATQLSQTLKRPWPNLPEALVLPQALGVTLIVCAGLAFLLPEPSRQAAWIGVGALSVAFLLQGLASVHALTRGLQVRNPLLFGLYMGCALEPRWVLPALALVGLLECFFSLRARRAAANAKP